GRIHPARGRAAAACNARWLSDIWEVMQGDENSPGALGPALAGTRLTRLYADHGRDVLAYALRRSASPEDAADAVAETFLVAWRRLADLPVGDEAPLWLYGVARRVLANQRRGERRRVRLAEQLRAELSRSVQTVSAEGSEDVLMGALARLEE